MRRIFLLAMLTAFGCASPPALPPAPPAEPPVVVAPSTPPPQADACGANLHQDLVGRPRTEIPVPINPELQRVACDSCPITQDYSPDRLNFFFDAASGRITKVSCG